MEVLQDFPTDETAAVRPVKAFGFGDSSGQKLQSSFCETLLLSLQTQRGKCPVTERPHPQYVHREGGAVVAGVQAHSHFRFISLSAKDVLNMYVKQ